MAVLRKSYLVVALGAILLLLAACGSTTGSNNNGSSNPSQTPSQVLQKTYSTMSQLKSEHFDLNLNSTTSASTGTGTTPSPTPGATGNPGRITITIMGSGDEMLPDQSSAKLTIGGGEAIKSTTISEIKIGQKLYIQNSKGQWFVIDASKFQGATGSPATGSDVSGYNNLLKVAQKAKLTDDGTETVNGTKLRHITVTFANDSLKDLLTATGQTNSASTSPLLNSIKLQKATLDVWVDESTSYTHKLELKLALNTGGSATATATTQPTSASSTTDTVINFSNFNQPVSIKAPANATPTDNILKAFQ